MTDRRLLKDRAALYHKTGENADGKALYKIFVLENVRFENRDSVYASNRGLKPYDGFKLYFSAEKSIASDSDGNGLKYISPITWATLATEEKSSYWTAAEHDLVTLNTDGTQESFDLDEMKENAEVYYINSVIPCRSFGEIKLLEITGRGRSVDSD